MDSNEKEFNGIGNEEVTETEVNENNGGEISQDEAVEETAANETEETVEETPAEEVSADEAPAADGAPTESDAAADNGENDSEGVQGDDGVAEVGEESDDGNVLYGGEVGEQPETKKKSNLPIITLIVVLAVVVAGLAYFAFGSHGNKYNKLGYVNVSGRTIQQIADGAGIDLKDFLSEYNLPEDMPGDTTEINAIYSMPAKVYLQNMIGIGFDDMKQAMNIPEETTPSKPKTLGEKIKGIFVKEKPQKIDENTPWYIIEGELTVNDYSGGSVDQFKEFYGLGDDVTGDTKLKDIQEQINQKTREMLAEQQAKETDQGASENGEGAGADQDGENSETTDGTENTEPQDPAASAETENTAE